MGRPSPLRPVGDEEGTAETSPEQTPDPAARLTTLLAGALALVSLLLAYQYQRAVELEEVADTLSAELQNTREELQVYERRREVVRSHVADLSARIRALQALVADEPSRRSSSDRAPLER